MNFRPFLQFYKTLFPFIAVFALVGIIAFGIMHGFLFFITLALVFAFFGFTTFYKEQWYTYQNLGMSKWHLFKVSFLINVLIGLPFFSLLFILISIIIGDFSIA